MGPVAPTMRAVARAAGITLPEARMTGMPMASSRITATWAAMESLRSGTVMVPSMSKTTALIGRSKGGFGLKFM